MTEVKTKTVNIKFKRKLVEAVETGVAKLEVPEGASQYDIEKMVHNNDFSMFLIKDRKSTYEWEWSVVKS